MGVWENFRKINVEIAHFPLVLPPSVGFTGSVMSVIQGLNFFQSMTGWDIHP